jgi:enoyl-CoA hydratase/carnithine racemase
MAERRYGDVSVALRGNVAELEIHRPPHNFLDVPLIRSLADALEALDEAAACRAVVLSSEGKSFCAGADFASRETEAPAGTTNPLYAQAVRLFACKKPVVAAVQGAAVGGGLGLALAADFRVATPESRFSCNFAKLGFHQGFGISVTLPAVVGQQRALELLYTGGQVKGAEALAIGLCDRLTSVDDLRAAAQEFAREIAAAGPLAVLAIRETMRGTLAEQVRVATAREHDAQQMLRRTDDFREGVAAMADRRAPNFTGR